MTIMSLLSAMTLGTLLVLHSATTATATATVITSTSTSTSTHHPHHVNAYSNKDATPYLAKIQSRKLNQSNLRRLKYQQQGGGGKENNNNTNKDKNATPQPSPSPTIAPTIAPSGRPTRSPVVVPWLDALTDGKVVLKVSLFTNENNESMDTSGTRLKAAEILDGTNDELIEDMLSSMATIICASNEWFKILTVVQGVFYDYCAMLLADDGQEVNQSDFEIVPDHDIFSSYYTYMVTDLTDAGTGFLDVEDRKVYVNTDDGKDYLHWTVWSVSYPIMKLGAAEDLSSTTINSTTLTITIEEAQMSSDSVFYTAISNNEVDRLLKEKSDKDLVTSLEGWEVAKFLKATDEYNDDTIPGLSDTTPQTQGHVFWQPVRICGVVMLGFLFIFVGSLMIVGHDRYKYDVWDARDSTSNTLNKSDEEIDLNLATCEGLDYMLSSGHQMRRESSNPLASTDPLLMNMGNTNSELAGGPASSTLKPLPKSMKMLFMGKLGLKSQDEIGDSEVVIPNGGSSAEGTGTPTRGLTNMYQTGTALLPPAYDSPERSPEALLNDFNDNRSGPPLTTCDSPVRRKLAPLHTGRKSKKNDTLTPQKMERVRPNEKDDGYYAFISVTAKPQNLN